VLIILRKSRKISEIWED